MENKPKNRKKHIHIAHSMLQCFKNKESVLTHSEYQLPQLPVHVPSEPRPASQEVFISPQNVSGVSHCFPASPPRTCMYNTYCLPNNVRIHNIYLPIYLLLFRNITCMWVRCFLVLSQFFKATAFRKPHLKHYSIMECTARQERLNVWNYSDKKNSRQVISLRTRKIHSHTSSLAQLVGPPLCARLEYFSSYWLDCDEVLDRHSWSSGDEFYWLTAPSLGQILHVHFGLWINICIPDDILFASALLCV